MGRRVLRWPGDPSSSGDSVPLRLCGSLHALALTGRRPALREVYSITQPSAVAWREISAAIEAEAEFLLGMLDSPPQTNEVARAAIVYPAFSLIAAQFGLPLELLEIGASAGLNLNADRFFYRIGEWSAGEPSSSVRLSPTSRGATPSGPEPMVVGRAGCDLRPFRLSDADERRRLLAYVWPDQSDRIDRTRAAIDIALQAPPAVERANAANWLWGRLASQAEHRVRVVYSTIAWQYLTGDDKARGEAAIFDAGGRASIDAPLAWVRFEADGDAPGAAITLDLWDGATHQRHDLGRADFHGRRIDWKGVGA